MGSWGREGLLLYFLFLHVSLINELLWSIIQRLRSLTQGVAIYSVLEVTLLSSRPLGKSDRRSVRVVRVFFLCLRLGIVCVEQIVRGTEGGPASQYAFFMLHLVVL